MRGILKRIVTFVSMVNKNQALSVGTVIRSRENSYTIEKVLGQGAFGITYRASTLIAMKLGKAKVRVALKEFFAEELDSRNRDGSVAPRTDGGIAQKYAKAFQRESENLSKMDHPGIIHVLEAFEANGTYYYSMEYISGGSLNDKVKDVGMPEEEALPLLYKAAYIDEKNLNTVRSIGWCLIMLGDYAKAEEYLTKIQEEQQNYNDLLNLGHCLYAQGQIQEAFAAYRRGHELSQQKENGHNDFITDFKRDYLALKLQGKGNHTSMPLMIDAICDVPPVSS